jgi:hypothetical protein
MTIHSVVIHPRLPSNEDYIKPHDYLQIMFNKDPLPILTSNKPMTGSIMDNMNQKFSNQQAQHQNLITASIFESITK